MAVELMLGEPELPRERRGAELSKSAGRLARRNA
jgi:hypothetical protein